MGRLAGGLGAGPANGGGRSIHGAAGGSGSGAGVRVTAHPPPRSNARVGFALPKPGEADAGDSDGAFPPPRTARSGSPRRPPAWCVRWGPTAISSVSWGASVTPTARVLWANRHAKPSGRMPVGSLGTPTHLWCRGISWGLTRGERRRTGTWGTSFNDSPTRLRGDARLKEAASPLKIPCVCVRGCGEGRRGPAASPPRALPRRGQEKQTKPLCVRGREVPPAASPCQAPRESSLGQRQNHPRSAARVTPPPSLHRQAPGHQKCHPGEAEGRRAEEQALLTPTIPGRSYRWPGSSHHPTSRRASPRPGRWRGAPAFGRGQLAPTESNQPLPQPSWDKPRRAVTLPGPATYPSEAGL